MLIINRMEEDLKNKANKVVNAIIDSLYSRKIRHAF